MSDKLIFIVDDDKIILNLLEYTFKSKEGYIVKTFYSGEECLKNLHLNPDLIVLDHLFSLRGDKAMSGLETLKELRVKNPEIPVIILSGQEDLALIREFIKNGAIKYIPKADYFIDVLVESVEKVITN
jgi:Response regulator containing CheY-like receiver, AAA-type ATPase, and DNA-binding domains